MADILIRMEMPKVCIDNGWYGNCPMDRSWCAQRFAPKDSTNESAHKDQWNKLPSWCPLLPLPEGHGRLIDADKLADDLQFGVEYDQRALDDLNIVGIERERIQFDKDCKQNCMWYLTKCQSVIPAEGGTEDG